MEIQLVGQPSAAKSDLIRRLNGHSYYIVEHIFSYLDYESVVNAGKVPEWQDVLNNERIWKSLFKRNLDSDPIWRTIFNQIQRSGVADNQPIPSDDAFMSRKICLEVGNLRHQFIALMSSSVRLLSSSVELIRKVIRMLKFVGFGDPPSGNDSEDD